MIQFGRFDELCNTLSLTVCPLVGPTATRTVPVCYSRNLDVGGFLIFQPGSFAMYMVTLVMLFIMIYNIKVKTEGNGDVLLFLHYNYDIGDAAHRWNHTHRLKRLQAVHMGLTSATVWCLLLNGFVGFQWAEDGTPLSLWSMRISSLLILAMVTFISFATFENLFEVFDSTKPLALWIVYFFFNGAAMCIYFILQILLVVNTLDDLWPLGGIVFAAASFVAGQVILMLFSLEICESTSHYLDGLFLSVLCTLFAVMMIYKYWDSITRDDLEYTVDCRADHWELKGTKNYSKQ
ncbi:Chitin synthase, class 7 [Basidiobolus ranarum]|uniref:Chitin synthase export chaperone n=1 Tax=Basidiobolus ranarum TaxID=34480 RepID=A0ABR2W6L9_9FUNG